MKTVMIVDGEQTFHDFYQEMLDERDYEVINAYDSNGALSKLEENRPDLIVIDELSFLDMLLDERSARERFSRRVKDIPLIMASDFFLQVVLVQTLLARNK